MSLKDKMSFANKVVAKAKEELAKEKEENLMKQAKVLLADMQASKKTVALLERQLNNFMREIDLG